MGDIIGVDLETSDEVVELDHALFVPPPGGLQVVGDVTVANEACIIGCFLSGPNEGGTCIVLDDDGATKCLSPAETVEDCEMIREACH